MDQQSRDMQKQNMKKPVRQQNALGKKRLGLTVIIIAVVVVMVLAGSYGIMGLVEKRAHAAAESLVSDVVETIDHKMDEVREVTVEASVTVSEHLDDPQALEQIVRDFVRQNSFVYGSTVAFEPYAFPEKGRCFAPYSWQTPDGTIHSRQLGEETDFYEEEWYAETKASGSEYWCEPYFDEGGAKVMMCTFSVPLMDESGNLVAVMTADVGIDDLEEYIDSITPNDDSYIVLRSKRGNPLVNADLDETIGNNIIIKGMAEIGWSVELMIPFTYLMRGDTGIYFIIGIIILVSILVVYLFNQLITRLEQRSSEEYMNVIDAVSKGYTSIYLIDLLTDETVVFRDPENYEDIIGTIPDFTSRFNKLIDYDCYEPDRELMHRETTLPAIRSNLREQDRYVVRFRKEVGGEPLWYEMHGFVMERDGNGAPLRAVIAFSFVDDTVKKEMEAQETLEQALAMAQSANRAKTTFLNNMSHDIRTPMNAIIGYTGLAASHIESRELVQDYLSKIGQSSEHLLSLINDILDMSRIESGKMHLEEKEENLSEIVHALKNIVQADVHSKELDFLIDSIDVTDEDVVCDKLRLNQVLINILSNAVKYTQAGGTVSFRIAETAVTENGYGTYEFRVKDNGMGMSKEFLDTIFDPFTRVQSSTVSGIQGTGLGMAITKNIVDMMGGTIGISSKESEGTEVTVRFSFKLAGSHKAPGKIAELEGLRSLVVDDDSNTCLSVQRMLKECGMRSDWCTSGKEAVVRTEAAVQDGDLFKVYIIDWLMPDMNGIETTRRIRHVIGNDAPIIILTAYDWSDIEEEAREAGVTAFISKPLFPSDLHSILESCVGAQTYIEEATDEFDFTGRKILLVEDNEMNREIAEEILTEAGFVVDTAEDGTVAVAKMKAAQPGDYDLILMDIQMPIMNGYDATREIRAMDGEMADIPIIAMTANAFEEDRRLALEAGMNEHIAKPIDIPKMKKTIAGFLK